MGLLHGSYGCATLFLPSFAIGFGGRAVVTVAGLNVTKLTAMW